MIPVCNVIEVQIFQVLIVCLVVKMGNVKVPLIPMGLVSLVNLDILDPIVLLPAVAMEPVIILLMALENVFPVILDLRDQIAMLVMIKLIVYTEFDVFQFRP